MMNFVLLTLSIMVAILLASVLAFVVMLNTKVMKWYMNYIVKMMSRMEELVDDQMYKGL